MPVDAGVLVWVAILFGAALAAALIGRVAARIFLRASGDRPARR